MTYNVKLFLYEMDMLLNNTYLDFEICIFVNIHAFHIYDASRYILLKFVRLYL